MRFDAAGWLILLMPWLVLAAWLWRRERQLAHVSSRFLWPVTASVSAQEDNRSVPPAWIIAALLSLLAAILALSNPTVLLSQPRLTVVVDRHVSMSASINGKSILAGLSEGLSNELQSTGTSAEIRVEVPGRTQPFESLRDLDSIRLTAGSTRTVIEARCAELERQGEVTIVLSAQQLCLPSAVLQYAPASVPVNRALSKVSVSVEPSPQVMVVIAHPRGQGPIDVIVTSEATSEVHRIEPIANEERTTAFFDLPKGIGDWIAVQLSGVDAFKTDDVAYLVRKGGWPRIEIAGDVPIAAERFAQVYSKQRPASRASASILFGRDVQNDRSMIVFAKPESAIGSQTASLDLPWRSIADVDQVAVTRVSRVVPEGFEVICRAGSAPIVAVKESEPRQVWIGFDVEAFAQTPQWVEWLDAVVDHLNGRGPPRWSSESVDAIGSGWSGIDIAPNADQSPGIYRREHDILTAANLPVVMWATMGSESQDLARLIHGTIQNGEFSTCKTLTGIAFGFAAIACLLIARQRRLDVRGGAT